MYGQYNPYVGATPQMQQRLNTLQGYQQQMYQPMPQSGVIPPQLKGRLVTNIEEAKAAQIDLDGSSTFFPCPAKGEVYEKAIDLNGLPIFRIYKLAENAVENPLAALQQRVERIEQSLLKGVTNHESDGTNDDAAK